MPSLEALAMAGADYNNCGASLVEREQRETPQYLLAADNDKPTAAATGKDVKLSAPPAQLWAKAAKQPFASTKQDK
ncbi:hypothetical protein LINGRAHAP2_LOCUS16207 [Linum grandiflorum]